MDVELIEIQDFLGRVTPFDLLPAEVLARLTREIEIRYVRQGATVLAPGDQVRFIYLVRTGAVETRDPDGAVLARLGEGECFGVRSVLRGGTALLHTLALEDSLLYQIPAPVFEALRHAHRQIEYTFAPLVGGSLARAQGVGKVVADAPLMTMRVGSLVGRDPVALPPTATVRAAAEVMRDQRVSCVLVIHEGAVVGIFTDRDLRNRVVAAGLGCDEPLHAVMSPHPVSIEAQAQAFDALLLMSRHNIRHLPVTRDGLLIGCLTSTNLIKLQATSAVHLVGDLHKQESAEGMAKVLGPVSDLVLQMAEAGMSAYHIGHVVSAITDAATLRLLRLAEKALGPPPVPYIWAAAGSQGRQEQTALSDQDNCLMLDEAFDPAVHGAYFEALTQRVCDGLDLCGYAYCPGGTMAMCPPWRRGVRAWTDLFRGWIDAPDTKALMLCSIFYDLRPVAGPRPLFEGWRSEVMDLARSHRAFLAHLADHALLHQPPLGFFRNFVLDRGGTNAKKLDLKHKGLVPIIDLARVYALASGVRPVNTHERLDQAALAGGVSAQGAANLREALDIISLTRLRHQARRVLAGQAVDNFLAPEDLSALERRSLKDAFTVVKTMQTALGHAFQTGRF